MTRWVVQLIALAVAIAGCDPGPPPGALTRSADAGSTEIAAGPLPVVADEDSTPFLAVGDIADCTTDADEAVAQLVGDRPGAIGILGDAVYEEGTLEEYETCFEPAWGPMWDRLRPAPGNHDYLTPGAAGYFQYFDERIRRPGRGWYGFNAGAHWRVVVLNTNCKFVSCAADSAQGRWLASQLAAASDRHVLAIAHHPRYSSGRHGSHRSMKPFFRLLYQARAALFLAGHDHSYERFAPQNARGERRANGVRQFVVGTGGRHLYPFERDRLRNTQRRSDDTFGVLQLNLRADGYSWQFVATPGGTFDDSGDHSLPVKEGSAP